MIAEAWGQAKDLMDWLEDQRIHPEITRDVLVKRIKRGWVPEDALTTPVIKGAAVGDSKTRIKAREEKMLHRARMFVLGQTVRRKYNAGVDVATLMERYTLSKSQVEKIVSKNEHYNIHWEGNKIPESFKETVGKLKENETD